MRPTWAFVGIALVSACLEQPQIDETTQDINGPSSLASSWQRARAAVPSNCTATRIGSRWAITALHCLAPKPPATVPGTRIGAGVSFYNSNGQLAGSATIVDIKTRPGTNAVACQATTTSITGCYDSTNHVADIALLQLANNNGSDPASNDPLDAPQGVMAWVYPGNNVAGVQVGAGQHDGATNPNRVLLQVANTTSDSSDSLGDFHLSSIRVDPGDSGGPFYVNNQILGDLHGNTSLFSATYTSIPFHLDWILTTIGYQWPGSPSQSGIAYSGTITQSFVGTEQMCQYACENTASCQGYNYVPTNRSCFLYTNIAGTYALTNVHSALRWGQGSGRSNLATAYVRSDNISAVVHRAGGGAVDELLPGPTPALAGSLFQYGPPPPAVGKVSGYRRADGVNAVVYRDAGGHIIELALGPSGWTPNELTSFGGPLAVGDPVAYVRADHVSAVVYRSTNNHIIELRAATNTWVALDLTVQSGVGVNATSDPSPTVRADGLSSVTFISGGQVFELFKAPGLAWDWGEPSAFAPGAPAAGAKPFGYTQHDGTYAIIYGAADGRVIALWQGGGWNVQEVVPGAPHIAFGSTPAAYVRSDGIESIVYRTTTNSLEELTNNGLWQKWDLSALFAIPSANSDPTASIRAESRNSVVFTTPGNHARELSFHIGETSWTLRDLTAESGETP